MRYPAQEDRARGRERPQGIRQALEALVEKPDELASHVAYADWLSEQDDEKDRIRGEFIPAQIALEEESLPAERRKTLRDKENRLLEEHQRERLGELAPYLLDRYCTRKDVESCCSIVTSFEFRRGWLDSLHLWFLSLSLARVLRQAPQAILLRHSGRATPLGVITVTEWWKTRRARSRR